MNTQDLKSEFVKVLKKRDKAWFISAANSLGKQPDEVTYSDLASVSFGEFTASRVGVGVEFLFGVCLPLRVRYKKWTTEEYFNYLKDRSKKTNVNLRLARSRTDPPGITTTVRVALTSVFLLFLPILLYVLWQFAGQRTVVLAILALLIPTLMIFDYLWTHSYYLRLARRIEEMRD